MWRRVSRLDFRSPRSRCAWSGFFTSLSCTLLFISTLWISTLWPPALLVAAPPSPATPDATKPVAVSPGEIDPQERLRREAPREIGPEIYYIPDARGRLRPAVLNELTFEEFKRLLGRRASQRGLPPQYVLTELDVTADAGNDTADLKISIRILNRASADDAWVPIPLKMGSLIFSPDRPALYEGEGDFYINYDTDREGYVIWLRGGKEQPHRFTLQGKVLLQRVGSERQLKLRIPRATQSAFELRIPQADQSIRLLSGGSIGEVQESEGETRARLEGIAGEMQLAWRPALVRNAPRMQALDVAGRQRIEMDGGQIRTEAVLRIQSFAGPFDRFRVKLPPESRLLRESAEGYSIQINEQEGDAGESGWVDVKLNQRTKGPVEIRLASQQIRDLSRPEETTELAGFDVEGSIRQSGRIDVFVTGDWQVRWSNDENTRFDIRRVDAPSDLPLTSDWAASFEYYRQPYSLKAEIEPPNTEVAVEPELYFDIEKDRVVLDARFKYQIRGARVFDLHIDMKDWNVLPGGIGPVERIDSSGLRVNDDGQLTIPFQRSVGGDFEISVRAERALAADADVLTLPLPQPQADRLDATVVAISPADDVEFIPREGGQLQDRVPSGAKARFDVRQQEPLFYLFERGEEVPTAMTGDIRFRQREISSQVKSRIRLSAKEMEVEQTLRFDVRYQRIDSISLLVPKELLGEADLIRRGGKSLPLLVVDEDLSAEVSQVRVPLENAIGEVVLDVAYRREADALEPGTLSSMTTPLVMPAEGTLEENELLLESAEGMEMDLIGEAWEPVDSSDGAVAGEVDFEAARYRIEKPMSEVVILAGMSEDSLSRQITVRRGFLQTWLTPQSRYDRVTLLLDNRAAFFDFEFPEDVARSGIGVRLDRERADVRWLSGQRLRIALQSPTSHVLEIEWKTPSRPMEDNAFFGQRVGLAMPALPDSVQLQRPLYWQVVLPQMQHLLAGPAEAVSYNEWQWRRAGWRRIPLVGERELAQWAGADARQNDLPGKSRLATAGINRYLFRLPEWPQQLSVLTIPRTMLVLIPAGIVLAAGMACIYIPRLRRGKLAFALAIGLLAAGLLYPEPAAMVIQMGLLGLVLTLLALFLRKMLRGRGVEQIIIERTTGSSHRQRTTELHHYEMVPQTTSSVTQISSGESSLHAGPLEAPLDGSVAEPKS
ncbi:MAG: hypothetical protein VX431_00915 [Planctomycetota bacterium]|nr:hypothetical protein [Planctomycetota bacterium]